MRRIDLEHSTLEQLTLAPGERVLIDYQGTTVELRVKPRYRAQHAHLWLWGLVVRRFRNQQTIVANWIPVRIDGSRISHTIMVKTSGVISRTSLEHEFVHVEQMRRHGNFKYSRLYATPRGRLKLEAEANAELVRGVYQGGSYTHFMSWLVDKANRMISSYSMRWITFRPVTVLEVQAALLDAAEIPHDGGIPVERIERDP